MLLTDRTLMALDDTRVPPDRLRRLYLALIAAGVKVQIPFAMADALSGVLMPEQTLMDFGAKDMIPAGFAGYIRGVGEGGQKPPSQKYRCGARAVPGTNGCRLLVDADWFLEDYQTLFARFQKQSDMTVTLCASGATPLATALTLDWLLGGYGRAVVCWMGRGGYASLAETVMALQLHRADAVCPEALREVADAWEALTGREIPPYQPVVGRRIFDVASGVHVNALLKDEESYEPFAPDAVGAKRRIILGKHSGASAVTARLMDIGIDPDGLDVQLLARNVRDVGARIGEVDDDALRQLVCEACKEALV